MKKLLFLFGLLLCVATHAHAACTAATPGMTESQVVTLISSCHTAGGGSILFPAGSYGPFTSNFTLPCGVSLSGPVIPYTQTHYQTAVFIGSSSSGGQPLQTTAGCGSIQNIQYLEWNGEQPASANGGSGGGGFIQISEGTTNLSIHNNWIHGMTACNSDSCGDQSTQANGIYFCCDGGSPLTQNVTITMNEFGSESYSDCAQAMLAVQTENGGGFCNGVGIHTNTQNVTVNNNNFHWLEQGMKYYESSAGGGYCNNDIFDYNDFQHIQRIPYETQCNLGANPATPTLMYIQYNSFGQRYNGNGGQQNYDLSSANGCTTGSSSTCKIINDDNIDIAPVSLTGKSVGFEIWGAQGTTANYNFFQGFMLNSITFSANGSFTFNNNFMNNPFGSGQSQNCNAGTGIYWNQEQSTSFNPGCSGNTYSTVGTGTLTSAAPSLSPASGSFTGSQTVTLTNTGTNRDTNTSIWYTTDGSTPVPGSGTATLYTVPFSVTTTTTVKAVGMWGAVNQPHSYPASYGYVPSSTVSATYTNGGSPGATTPTATPGSGTYAVTQSVSLSTPSPGAIICYNTTGSPATNGSSGCSTGTLYTGSISVPSSRTLFFVAGGTGYSDSSVGSATYMIGTFAATPTFSPVAGSYVGTQSVVLSTASGTVICYNTTGSPATNGGTGCATGTHYTGAVSVATSETLFAVAGGTGFTDSSVGSAAYTIAAPIPQGGYLGAPGNQNTANVGGASIPFTATITYTNTSANNDLPDGYGNTVATWSIIAGTSPACGTINSSGVFTPTTNPTDTGTCNVKATCSCTASITLSQWTMTINAAVVAPAVPAITVIVISENDGPEEWKDWLQSFGDSVRYGYPVLDGYWIAGD